MTTHILNGFSMIFDETQPGGPTVETFPISMTLVVPDAETSFSYQVLSATPGELPNVEININDIMIAINSLLIDNIEINSPSEIEAYVGQIGWGAGNVTQVMNFEFDQGDTTLSLVIPIGGDAIPAFNSLAELTAFENSITSVGAIPGASSFAAGKSIAFSSLLGVETLADNFVTGTTGDETLMGTAGNDYINPMSNNVSDVIIGSTGDDIIDFSNIDVGTVDAFSVLYNSLSAGITVEIDHEFAISTVDKGANGFDNLVDAERAMDWKYGDSLWIGGTDHNDTFNFNLEADTWVGVEGGAGVDSYNIRTDSIVRIGFAGGATQGVNVNMISGAVANDGHGNVEQINVLNAGAQIEIEGTNFNDNIQGSNRDERFILHQGNDTLDAGGGWDRLRYDRAGVDAVNVNLATGIATGMWDGAAFNHSFSGIEDVRGSRNDDDVLTGDGNNNSLDGRGGNDTLNGGGGDDTLRGDQGDDVIDGGAGTDYAQFDMNRASATITGTSASVTVVSSQGTDVLTNIEFLNFQDQQFDVSSLGAGSTSPTEGPDSLEGTSGNDSIDGLGGDDTILGLGGNDTLLGGAGSDRLEGGNGDDFINPGENIEGWDQILTGAGNDTVDMSDIVQGGVGIGHWDLNAGIIATVNGATNTGTIDKGVNGTTTLVNVVNPMNYWGFGLTGTSADDTFNIAMDGSKYQWLSVEGGAGNNTINITGGSDLNTLRLDYGGAFSAITANLATGLIVNGLGGADTIDDTINGTGPRIELRASNYTDTITGSTASERFILRGGDDTLDAGDGWDLLRYDRSGVNGLNVDLSTGTATGMWNGTAFTHTISNVEEVRGTTAQGDMLTGDASKNVLDGRGGNDSLMGLGGDDTLLGDAGNDTLRGGEGDDELSAGSGNDLVFGGNGDDLFISTSGADTFNGGAGIDTFFSDGTDEVPKAYIGFFNLITGSAGSTSGGNIDTLIDVENFTMLGDIDMIVTGNDANNRFETSLGDDTLLGGIGSDHLISRQGDDALDGGNGFDTLESGEGNDTVTGGDGRDMAYLGAGNDIFYDNEQGGENGQDTVYGNAGDDTIEGGAGFDMFYGGNDNDLIYGRAGFDTLDGGIGNDSIFGGNGNDMILGAGGFDTIDGGNGNDTIDGGDGRDMVYMGAGADLYNDNAQGGENGQDTVYGNQGNDTIEGGAGFDMFYGGNDNDLIYGRAGFDTLDGGSGSDSIFGGNGNDEIFGGGGFDTIDGGNGNDTIDGGDGRDVVYMGNGNDTFLDNTQGGDLGRDAVYAGNGNDIIQGGNGNDTFFGGNGDDLIFGRLGDDLINGGAGNDTMDGGPGADTFVFETGFGVDVINGYEAGGDTLQFNAALWTGTLSAAQVVDQFASVVGSDVVFDFGAEEVTLTGISSLTGLENDLVIV